MLAAGSSASATRAIRAISPGVRRDLVVGFMMFSAGWFRACRPSGVNLSEQHKSVFQELSLGGEQQRGKLPRPVRQFGRIRLPGQRGHARRMQQQSRVSRAFAK